MPENSGKEARHEFTRTTRERHEDRIRCPIVEERDDEDREAFWKTKFDTCGRIERIFDSNMILQALNACESNEKESNMSSNRPIRRLLWTSAEVARALRVGVSSVKRWTDSGQLETAKTVGGHRRYALDSVHAFARKRGLATDDLPPIPEEMTDVSGVLNEEETRNNFLIALEKGDADGARRIIHSGVARSADKAAFIDAIVGLTLYEIGRLWETGKWGVESEHRASYIIAEIIDRLRPENPGGPPMAVVGCPPDEWHDLPARMLRLVLEWHGWPVDFLGANVPWPSISAAVAQSSPRLLLLTARTGEAFNSFDFRRLARECTTRGTTVCSGGEWARGGTGNESPYVRFRSLSGFGRWLRKLGG